jgi:hypothetical protein
MMEFDVVLKCGFFRLIVMDGNAGKRRRQLNPIADRLGKSGPIAKIKIEKQMII